jgi:hypothetical protein
MDEKNTVKSINGIPVEDTEAREAAASKIGKAELDAAVKEALTQAKESGDFKGDKGDPGDDYIITEADKTEIAEEAADIVDDALSGYMDLGMTGAAVGQVARIAAVDADGKPTAWEPVEMPEGGGGSGGAVSEMVGATADTAGAAGLVPAPAAGDNGKVLFGDGTWGEISSGGGDVWEPILAYIPPRPTLVNLGGVEGLDANTTGNPYVKINAAGTTAVEFPLGASFKKLFIRARSGSVSVCTAGKVKLTLPDQPSKMRDMAELTGTGTWTDLVWQLDINKGFISQLCYGVYNPIVRTFDTEVAKSTSKITLVTTTADATFNEFQVEIWGVRA